MNQHMVSGTTILICISLKVHSKNILSLKTQSLNLLTQSSKNKGLTISDRKLKLGQKELISVTVKNELTRNTTRVSESYYRLPSVNSVLKQSLWFNVWRGLMNYKKNTLMFRKRRRSLIKWLNCCRKQLLTHLRPVIW